MHCLPTSYKTYWFIHTPSNPYEALNSYSAFLLSICVTHGRMCGREKSGINKKPILINQLIHFVQIYCTILQGNNVRLTTHLTRRSLNMGFGKCMTQLIQMITCVQAEQCVHWRAERKLTEDIFLCVNIDIKGMQTIAEHTHTHTHT